MTPAELLASLPEGATPGPWVGDRYDGTVKYDVLGADGSTVIHGDNANSGSDTPYGIHEPDDGYDSNEKLILAAPQLRDALRETLEENERLREGVVTAICIPGGEPVTRDPVKLAAYAAEQLSAEVAMVSQLIDEIGRLRSTLTTVRAFVQEEHDRFEADKNGAIREAIDATLGPSDG